MSFTVEDFHDLVRLVTERPEWRADLRRLVLTEEFLSLPEQLAKFQLRTEERFQIVEGQLASLITQVNALTVRVDSLTAQVHALTVQVSALTKTVESLVVDVGELKGESLENRYRTRASAYFSRLMRKIHVLSSEELASLLDEGVDTGAISERDAEDILLADLVVRGKQRNDGSEIYLVVEVSWGVGPYDVERAVRRSQLLAKTGLTTMPVVAGRQISPEARQLAQRQHVRQITDGQSISIE